jgi:5-methyltetrahydropteroyltriglutamate--homocysteine methyltransferase
MANDYRADHIGSFLRPAEILEARRAGDAERLRAIEDQHILRVLEMQRELGFELATDGELRRRNFMSDFTDAVDGFDLGDGVDRAWQGGAEGEKTAARQATAAQAPGVSAAGGSAPAASAARDKAVSSVTGIVTAKLHQARALTGHELPFMQEHCKVAIKMTLPSATQFPAIAFKAGVTDKIYADRSALLWDIVAIMKKELAALAEGGVKYIQIDAPRYSYYMDPKWREWIRTEMKVDPDAALDEAVSADSACFRAARRSGVTLGIHLCRGNNRSHWYAEGGYDAIAEKLFNGLDVDRFLLEYDDARSGTFEPLRFVPRGKTVVLGLVSSKVPALEDPNLLARRVEEASKFVPMENLALSPQCGFASTAEGNLLSEADQWAKLKLVAETARMIWG